MSQEPITSLLDAQLKLHLMEADFESRLGRAEMEGMHNDLVRGVMRQCTPGVAAELARNYGLTYQGQGHRQVVTREDLLVIMGVLLTPEQLDRPIRILEDRTARQFLITAEAEDRLKNPADGA